MKKAFTLIELLVVVLIIGILAAVALPQYQKAVNKSKLTEGIIAMSALGRAQQVYYLANGDYADNLDELDVSADLTALSKNWSLIRLNRVGGRPHMEAMANFLPTSVWIVYQLDESTLYCSQNSTAKENRMCQGFFGNTEAVADPTHADYEMYKIQ